MFSRSRQSCLILPVAPLHGCRFEIAKPPATTMSEEDSPTLKPVKTVCIMVRNVPVSTKLRLTRIRHERGWVSWLDMIDEIVQLWDSEYNTE